MKGNKAVSIIGGADGPTSIFIAGHAGKRSFRERMRQGIYRHRRRKAEKMICACPHTLEEVVDYVSKRYSTTEIPSTQKKYIEQYESAREGLIITQRPELLGGLREVPRPTVWDEEAVREWHNQSKLRSEKIALIPDSEMPMDFHIYEIRIEGGWMELEIDFRWEIFGMSYSGDKRSMKKMKAVAREVYLYYGVSQEDIANRTKRYSSLLTMLSSE